MEISVKRGHPQEQKTACLIVGVHAGKKLSSAAEAIDKALGGTLTKLFKRGDLTGAMGETLMLHEAPGTSAERVLVMGCGKIEGVEAAEYQQIVGKAARAVADAGLRNAVACLTELEVKERDTHWKTLQAALAFHNSTYRFDQMKSKPSKKTRCAKLTLLVESVRNAEAERAVAIADGMAEGLNLTKDLANLPGNHCPPKQLADAAKALGKAHKSLKVTVLERAEMEALGMGSLLAVAQGSAEAPKLITLEYTGDAGKSRPIVLVGKGVTFDSGGISIKPGPGMDEMKFDMCGAASVLGVMKAVASLGLAVNVVGVIPAVENMPDGKAIKPGDVVTSMSGQTIEILNTDAEGRLVLCDALTYAERFKPSAVIDIATLTGACVVALGGVNSGLFSTDDSLADALLAAGKQALDPAWRMPLDEAYQEQLKSNFADMANIGGPPAGAVTAACFLSRFAKAYSWAHLDIAGTAWRGGKEKGSTARPVPLLVQYLLNQA
jgi:leucyl aminopeptidase